MLKGDLVSTPLPAVLRQLADGVVSGCLHVDDGVGEEAKVFLRGGQVYSVQVPGRRPQLGARLVSSGALAPEALAEALEAQRTELQGWRLGELLVHLGYVDQPVVEAFVDEQLREQAGDLMRWPTGTWKFRVNERTREDVAPPTSVEELLAAIESRRVQWETITEVLHGPDAVPMLSAAGQTDAEMSIDPDAWSLLCKVDGVRSLSELARECGFTLFEAGQVVYSLVRSGLLEVEEVVVGAETVTLPETLDVGSVADRLTAAFAPAPEPEVVIPSQPADFNAADLANLVANALREDRTLEPTPTTDDIDASVGRVSQALSALLGDNHTSDDLFAARKPRDSKPKPEKRKTAIELERERRAAARAEASAKRRAADAEELARAQAELEAARAAEAEASAAQLAAGHEAEVVNLDAARKAAEERVAEEQAAAEEAARIAAEEEAARLAAEEEAARVAAEEQAAAEEAARIAAEEEAARVAAEEQAAAEEAARIAAEEEAARLAAEAEAARVAAEAEAARVAAEEQAAAEEAARLAAEEEAARIAAEEEAARVAAAEEAARLAAEEEAARVAAEEEATRIAAEEQAAAEEAARIAAEEEAARLAAEEEAARIAAEEQAAAEEAARIAAEEEAARIAAEEQAAAEAEAARIAAEEQAAAEEAARIAAEAEAARIAAEEQAAAEEAARIAAEERARIEAELRETARREAAEEESRRKAEAEAAELAERARLLAEQEAADEEARLRSEQRAHAADLFAELSATAATAGDTLVERAVVTETELETEALDEVDDRPLPTYPPADTDMASLFRELSSLGMEDEPASPPPPVRPAPKPVVPAKQKKKGLFGR